MMMEITYVLHVTELGVVLIAMQQVFVSPVMDKEKKLIKVMLNQV